MQKRQNTKRQNANKTKCNKTECKCDKIQKDNSTQLKAEFVVYPINTTERHTRKVALSNNTV